MGNYSPESLSRFAAEIFQYLDRVGSATKGMIQRELGWPMWRVIQVLQSQPEWLVVVGRKRVVHHGQGHFLYAARGEHILGNCPQCGKRNFDPRVMGKPCRNCREGPAKKVCESIVVDAHLPTDAGPGSDLKIRVLQARHLAGLPLWHDDDEQRIASDDFKYFQPGEDWDEDDD
jgi:hypothetical protein